MFLTENCKISCMRITEAARRLDMTPRMLRYRETLGLLPVLRHGTAQGRTRRPAPAARSAHRQFTEADLSAVSLGVSLERRYDISPVALAFGVRVLADPRVRAEVAEFGRRVRMPCGPVVQVIPGELGELAIAVAVHVASWPAGLTYRLARFRARSGRPGR